MKPTVSILCITYNQEKFISKTLDGFISQEADFSYEVLIHDDASTDNTRAIIDSYASKHPGIFKTFYEDENQYSKGTFDFVNDMFRASKGEYIAFCEGDDYWTDPQKLQKQVNFLRASTQYALCFHPVKIVYDDKSHEDIVSSVMNGTKKYTLGELLKDNYIYTCSVMYRRADYKNLVHSILPQDLYLHLYHAQNGKIGFLKDVMASYRKQPDGVWWDAGDRMKNIYSKHRYQLTNLFAVLLDMFKDKPQYRHTINLHINYLLDSFITIDKSKKTDLFVQTTRDFPELVAGYALRKYELLNETSVEKERLQGLSDNQAHELQNIKDSKWYRLNPKVIAHRHEHESDTR